MADLRIARQKRDAYFCAQLDAVVRRSALRETGRYIQHGDTSCLLHSIAVAYFSYRTARLLQRIAAFHERDLIRGALLHDYFLYDWHIPDPTHRLHGFRHPGRALENAQRDFVLSDIERDIIRKHMFPLTPALPRYRESLLVSAVDKACSVYECFRHPAYPRLRARIYRVLEGTVR